MSSPWPPPCGYLPVKQPADVAPRSFTIAPLPSIDVTEVELAAAPSGTGELTLSGLDVAGTTASFVVSGGVAGRVYTLAALATDTAGNTYETLAFLPMSLLFVADPPVVPPSQGFGPLLVWPYVPSFSLADYRNNFFIANLMGL